MVWQSVDRRKKNDSGPGLPDKLRDTINDLAKLVPVKQGATLPALDAVQNELGYLPPRAIEEIAQLLGITASDILDTLTIYSHFWQTPRGRHVIIACHGISCDICGCGKLLEALKQKLSVGEHETTSDGRFSLVTEDCIGNCEKAPCLLIDDECVGPVRAADLDQVLSNYP